MLQQVCFHCYVFYAADIKIVITALQLTVTPQPTCLGGSSGSIDATVSGGSGGYTFAVRKYITPM